MCPSHIWELPANWTASVEAAGYALLHAWAVEVVVAAHHLDDVLLPPEVLEADLAEL